MTTAKPGTGTRIGASILFVAAFSLASCPDSSNPEPEPSEPPPTTPDVAGGTEDDERWIELHRSTDPAAIAALERVRDSLEARPDDVQLLVQHARQLYKFGRSARAKSELARALELDPKAFNAHYQLGVVLYGEASYEDAVRALETAIELAPAFAPAQRELGLALLELGRDAKALAAFEACTSIDAERPECLYQAALLVEEDDAKRAAVLLERATRLDEAHLGAHLNLARLYRVLGRTTDAERIQAIHAELALLADLGVLHRPNSTQRFITQGQLYANNGRIEEALAVCERGRKLHPDHGELAYLHGILLARSDRPGDAQKALLTAIAASPQDLRPVLDLARLFTGDGETPPAVDGVVETLRSYSKRVPGEPLLSKALGRIDVD